MFFWSAIQSCMDILACYVMSSRVAVVYYAAFLSSSRCLYLEYRLMICNFAGGKHNLFGARICLASYWLIILHFTWLYCCLTRTHNCIAYIFTLATWADWFSVQYCVIPGGDKDSAGCVSRCGEDSPLVLFYNLYICELSLNCDTDMQCCRCLNRQLSYICCRN